jgi:hypothetical protein
LGSRVVLRRSTQALKVMNTRIEVEPLGAPLLGSRTEKAGVIELSLARGMAAGVTYRHTRRPAAVQAVLEIGATQVDVSINAKRLCGAGLRQKTSLRCYGSRMPTQSRLRRSVNSKTCNRS